MSLRDASTLRAASRANSRQQNVVQDPNLDTLAGSKGDDESLVAADPAIVRAAMSHLGKADQRVLHLFYFERQSYAQIAERMELSINTIGPKLKRAQQRLRKIIDSQQSDSRDHMSTQPGDLRLLLQLMEGTLPAADRTALRARFAADRELRRRWEYLNNLPSMTADDALAVEHIAIDHVAAFIDGRLPADAAVRFETESWKSPALLLELVSMTQSNGVPAVPDDMTNRLLAMMPPPPSMREEPLAGNRHGHDIPVNIINQRPPDTEHRASACLPGNRADLPGRRLLADNAKPGQ